MPNDHEYKHAGKEPEPFCSLQITRLESIGWEDFTTTIRLSGNGLTTPLFSMPDGIKLNLIF